MTAISNDKVSSMKPIWMVAIFAAIAAALIGGIALTQWGEIPLLTMFSPAGAGGSVTMPQPMAKAATDALRAVPTLTPFMPQTYTPTLPPSPTPTETPSPTPTAIPTVTPSPTPTATPTSGPKSIIVDLSDQRLYAYAGSQLAFSFVASTGQDNSTLTGTFTILDKEPDAWSDPWGFWMPDWMGIYYVGGDLEDGIHALPVLTNGTSLWGDALGTPVSYGCVVLDPADASQLFAWAEVGTPVLIRP